MNPYETYDHDLRTCKKCAPILSAKLVDPRRGEERVVPRPIVTALRAKPIMLIGQAPGLTEYESGKPFSGPAGKDIREVFSECGLDAEQFSALVHTSAIVKCFPGSKLVPRRRGDGMRREDEKPSSAMIKNCRPFLERQLDLVNPRVLVLLGSFPLQAYLRLRGLAGGQAKLVHHVGRVEDWQGRRVVVLPHTSGSSYWLNDETNRQLFLSAKRCLRDEVTRLST
jgi:uracil-DNA glycosylase family 4